MRELWPHNQVEASSVLRATQAADVFNRESAPRPDEIAGVYSHLVPEEVEKIRKKKAAVRRAIKKANKNK